MAEPSLLVVGAGPAGLSAAAEATRAGVRTLLVDAADVAGGQLFARPPAGDWRAGLPAHLTAGLRPEWLTVRLRTAVWGAFGDAVALVCDDRCELVRPRAIVLATGAVERALPFTGWDAANVVAPGALQRLLKVSQVVPAGRVVIAGSGPFLLAVAAELRAAGADVAAVLERRSRRALAPLLAALARDGDRRRQALGLARQLRGVPLRFGVTVRRADAAGLRLSDGSRLAADVAAVGHGFAPRLELARLLGCATGPRGVVVDAAMATTRPGVFAAGELAGIGGGPLAAAEGRLAGLAAARHLGHTVPDAHQRTLHARRARHARFAAALARAYPDVPVLALAEPETTVCRCEGVTLEALRRATAQPAGARDARDAKAELRCGMGPCQGTMCAEAVRAAVGATAALPDRREPRIRPPLAPVTVGALAGTSEVDQ